MNHEIISRGETFLQHYGVKGMKWGLRRKRGSNGRVKGSAFPKAKDMSDDDLKKAVARMQLERQYNQLVAPKANNPAKKAVAAGAAFVSGIALNVARTSIQNQMSAKVAKELEKKAKKKAVNS